MDEKDIEKMIDSPNRTQVPQFIGSKSLEDRMQLVSDLISSLDVTPDAASLIYKSGNGKAEVIKLGEVTVVGRSSGADFTLNDDFVSRKHFQVALSADGAQLKDLDSVNGIKLNGLPIKEKLLAEGDIIEVSTHSFMYFNPEA